MTPTAIDLFSGAGGMTLGLTRAGFDVRLGVDNWGTAMDSYARNFSHSTLNRDIAGIEGSDLLSAARLHEGGLDLLAGGPPCQGFSRQRIGGDEDDRNELIVHFARLVSETRPRFFLMENVPGLLGRRGRAALAEFDEVVSEAGYVYRVDSIDAVEFGVPQSRKRVIFIGAQAPIKDLPRIDGEPRPICTVRDAFAGLPAPFPPGTVDVSDPLHVQSRMSELNQARLKLIPPGGGFEDLPVEMRVRAHQNGAQKIGHRAVYGRLHPDRPAGVITARFDSFTRGRFAHPIEDRNITLREGARLQTFPDDFMFQGNREEIAAQIGNAVPPKVAEMIGASLFRALDGLQTSPQAAPSSA